MMNFDRQRRLRIHPSLRKALAETQIRPSQLVKPLFIHGGTHNIPLPQLPDSAVLSLSKGLLPAVEALMKLGILGVNLYPSLERERKNAKGTEALNPEGLIPQAISMIKEHFPECMVFPDIALDPYTSHGHDGLIDEKGQILNDESIALLAQQSVLFAKHGADMVAPSDQFDGRTLAIRNALDQAGFSYVGIISYSAKYASAYYSPFRSAMGNDHLQKIDKSTYQLDPANTRQALAKIETEIQEGADIVMIKPAGHYLDIVSAARALTDKPIAVFHVSGECAVLKLAAQHGLFDETRALREQILSMRRAGADLIFTYYAEKIANDPTQ